ncbi:MAG: diaminopimelate epimerase, partial [Verrucomicrobiales bacterium]
MNGAGNDFVVMNNRDGSRSLTSSQIALLCDRHRGVGADGVMLVENPEKGATARMRYYNADGSEAEMCGNGARCFAKFLNRLHGDTFSELTFETIAGIISATFPGDQGDVCVQLSDPFDLKLGQELTLADGKTHPTHSFNTGVPHAIVFQDAIDDIDIVPIGASVRYHEAFTP